MCIRDSNTSCSIYLIPVSELVSCDPIPLFTQKFPLFFVIFSQGLGGGNPLQFPAIKNAPEPPPSPQRQNRGELCGCSGETSILPNLIMILGKAETKRICPIIAFKIFHRDILPFIASGRHRLKQDQRRGLRNIQMAGKSARRQHRLNRILCPSGLGVILCPKDLQNRRFIKIGRFYARCV